MLGVSWIFGLAHLQRAAEGATQVVTNKRSLSADHMIVSYLRCHMLQNYRSDIVQYRFFFLNRYFVLNPDLKL